MSRESRRDSEVRRKNACIETGRRIKIQWWPTPTENIDERKEVAIVSIQGWPIERPRAASKRARDDEEKKDEVKKKEQDEGKTRMRERDLLSQRTPVTEC